MKKARSIPFWLLFSSIRIATLALAVSTVRAAVHQPKGYRAADCSLASVQAAVDLATNGDTVFIPAGTATWTNALTIYNKGISFFGAGTGQTVITNAWATAPSYAPALIDAQGSYPYYLRLSRFTICNSSGPYADINVGGITQTSYFRIDNVNFLNLSKTGVTPTGYALGVIDHCAFVTVTNGGATGVSITGEGAYSWDVRSPTWGDTNKVYVEDCSFSWSPAAQNGNGAVDSYNGARWCFRHNMVTNINVGDHGTDSSGNYRSTHSWEVYSNFFTNTTSSTYLFFAFRGGTGLIFSNIVYGRVYPYVALTNYRASGTNIYGGAIPCCNPWGPISGTNALDGNIDVSGWPPYDSIGRTSPTTYFANALAPNGIGTYGYTVQASHPTYSWANTVNGNALTNYVGSNLLNVGIYSYIPGASVVIQANRDFYDAPKPGYIPLAYPHPLTLKPANPTTLKATSP